MKGIIENFRNKNENYGKKGNNLKILMDLFKDNLDIIVPDTIILACSLYKKIITENGNTDFSDYNNIYINPQLTEEILNIIHAKFGDNKLVVRSSATCEDSIFFSGSGQYDSFLNINEDSKIIDAIKKVYASLFNKNSQLYSKIYNINLKKESMAILIQQVAPLIKSGVMFSCNPINYEKKYIIESTQGLGTNVVEGTGKINSAEIDYQDKEKVTNNELKKLIFIIDKIKDRFGFDVDIEWGIDKEKNIYIFQTRPVVFKDVFFDINYSEEYISKKCVPISKGFSIGKISNITTLDKGNILYQNEKYNFNDLSLLLSCKGVILKDDAKLSHFANILRELVKPCVYIKNFNFDKNKLYIIDAFKGNIINFEELNTIDKIDLMFKSFNYMKRILKDSFEKHNGIININNDDKFEQVVFNINEKKTMNLLKDNGFKKTVIKQGIYTYDFSDKSLIKNDTIFRIQISNGNISIQFKSLNTSNETYRSEKGILIDFDSLKNAKEFMKGYKMIETGFQERKIIKYILNDITVNVIKWPGCNPYLGIEVKLLEDLTKIKKLLKLEKCLITGWGGKQIFKKLNLTLKECTFNKKEEK